MATDRVTRDASVYDNESFGWSSPIRENYLGRDRGPPPTRSATATTTASATTTAAAALADGPARPAGSPRRGLPTQWAAQPAGW